MGILSGLFGSSKSKTKSKPWDPQADALEEGFNAARFLYRDQSGTPFYQGGLYAGLNPAQQAAIGSMRTTAASPAATGLGTGMAGAATAGMGQMGNYISNAQGILAGMTPQQIAADAGAYAANPHMDQMVDAASRDVARNLSEVELPGLNRQRSMGGNINSSRTGIAEGILTRGAQDRIADISAGLRGSAYGQGLNTALQARNLGLGANAQLAGAVNTGMAHAPTAYGQLMAPGSSLYELGSIEQADEQARMDAAYRRWLGEDTREGGLLDQYMGRVGGMMYGSQGYVPGASMAQQIGGIGALALGMYGMGK